MFLRTILFFLLLLSMVSTQAGDTDSNGRLNGRIKLFIEGDLISLSFIQENITFVDFVNDAFSSDVHVIVKQMKTGSGGYNYTLAFYSRTFTNIGNATLSAIVSPIDSKDNARKILLQTLKLGLMPYISQTTNISHIDIRNKHIKSNDTLAINTKKDRWNSWIFKIDLSGRMDLEEMKKTYAYSTDIWADRITDKWRIRNLISYDNQLRKIYKTVTTNQVTSKTSTDYRNISELFRSNAVYSLSKHWSTGVFFEYMTSTYQNIDHSVRINPAIEYNIYPWDEQTFRSFTLAYYAGPRFHLYNDTNIIGNIQSRLFAHSVLIKSEFVKPWGEIMSSLSASQFLNIPDMYSIDFYSLLSMRLVKGLSVTFRFDAASIHNQIYLPRKEASVEDVLSNTRKLPSTFEFGGNIGLRYQFGSIYNSVINNRL